MPRKKKLDDKSPDGKPILESLPKMSKKPQLVKGMKDILPQDQHYWHHFRGLIRKITQDYSFERLDPPIVEETSLYTYGIGKLTDIVEKEMYSFVDQGDNNLSLRPEFTASFARAYVEHGMMNLPQPQKLYTIGPLFRHEKPQEGRFRQHNQFNCEILGEEKSSADAQLIFIGFKFLKSLGIVPLLQINSIGCLTCRGPYREALGEYYKTKRNQVCEDCKRRMSKNVLRLLDCKNEQCALIKEKSPKMDEYWCEGCKNHFTSLVEFIDEFDIPHQYNPYLVRGNDYDTGTVFEFYAVLEREEEQRQLALGGGGRYDYLVELFGGQHTPACGFGIGLERIIMTLKEMEQLGLVQPIEKRQVVEVFFAQLGEKAKRRAMLLYEDLIQEGFSLAECFTKDSLKSQLEVANKLNTQFTLILGEKELMDGTIIIRNMEGGEQEVIDIKKLIPVLQKKLGHGEHGDQKGW